MKEEQGPLRQEIRGSLNATSVYGDAHVHYEGPVPSVLPEHLWMVPYRHNAFFTGREMLLTALHTSFTKDNTQGQAINGLGGIGKTQVAVEYAYRHQQEYRFILWVSAATYETLIAAFVSIADGLQLSERTLQEQDKIVAAVLHWLSTHEGWLLIVDNADDLEMVWPLLPTGSTGHVLVTTRDQAVGNLESFLVEQMDRAEGTLLLLRRARILKPGMELEHVSPADRQMAEQIVTEMDGLPLALDQAGAYVEETGCNLAKYMEYYQTQCVKLLKRRGHSSSNHPASVATTWSLSFEQVKQQNAIAADLLRLCAFLAPDAIPEEIIIKGASYLGEHLQGVAEDEGLLDEAIGVLKVYSLIRRHATEKTLSIHRLVQAVLRDTMSDDETKLWAKRTVLTVSETCPDVEFATWPQWERYLLHALACAEEIEQEDLMLLEAAHLLSNAGGYLYERGRYSEAEPLYVRALAIYEQQLGPLHPGTATGLNNLASLYESQGKYSEAEPLYVRALAIYEQQLGPLHPGTATGLNNLASLYESQGKYSEAEPLYVRALAIYEQQLGPLHPDTATGLNNLASLYESQGKYSEAEPLYVRALAIYEQQLGPLHPDTATGLNSLAYFYKSQGKYGEAEPLYVRALAIYEKALGPLHPDTARSLNNLAGLYYAQGKYELAEPLFVHALSIRERQLGAEHPDTAQSLNNLALFYNNQGKYGEAEPLFVRALSIWEQQLGPKHPDTATSLNNLALLYGAQGKYGEAEHLHQHTLTIREQQLGSEHPDTAASLNNLATLYECTGQV